MKKVLFGVTLALLFSGIIAGCSRTSAPAPAHDTTGSAPTGNTLTVAITGKASAAFLSVTRGNLAPVQKEITLPYSETFNTRPAEGFQFTCIAYQNANTPQAKPAENLRLKLTMDGKTVLEKPADNLAPHMVQATFNTPAQ